MVSLLQKVDSQIDNVTIQLLEDLLDAFLFNFEDSRKELQVDP